MAEIRAAKDIPITIKGEKLEELLKLRQRARKTDDRDMYARGIYDTLQWLLGNAFPPQLDDDL